MRGVEELPYAAGLVTRLPGYLRHPIALSEAHGVVGDRLARREDRFLALVRALLLADRSNPYRRLLDLAGCEYGDVAMLVRERGVEDALVVLASNGVYLTVDEIKGRSEVVRGGVTFAAGPGAIRNPAASRHVAARSSGSRGEGTHVHFGLGFIRDCAVNAMLSLEARGGLGWEKAVWEMPGAGALFRLVKYSSFGRPVSAWFTPVELDAHGLHPRYRLGERAVRLASTLSGRALPRPLLGSIADPTPVARWMAVRRREGRVPHALCFSSAAVRLCLAAEAAGVDISGAQLTLAGEPVTAARIDVVLRSGAVPTARYGSIETGPIGYGCLTPAAPDDVHVLSDLHAVVHAGAAAGDLPADALLVTSLLSTAPFAFLNASLGDRAVIEQRACGCRLGELGWATHLRDVRSFEKLTGGGVSFLGSDVVRLLEVELPARFGGAPTDYQLVESQTPEGLPRVSLLVDPRVGSVDEAEVVATLLSTLAPGDSGERLMGVVWEQGDVIRVERHPPRTTRSGKVQHFVIDG